jgi:uncharacterized protein (DUF305 family)
MRLVGQSACRAHQENWHVRLGRSRSREGTVLSKHATAVTGAILLTIGILGMMLTLFLGQSSGMGAALGGQSWMSSEPMSTNMDAMFIEEMIPHHDDAIAMGELAITRAEHPELRQLGEDIVRNQTAENAQMRRWYRTWYGVEAPESSGMSGAMGFMMGGGVVDLADLENAEEFD